jgi:hypothetical protein
MLGVGTRVRLRLDRGCRRQHARHRDGQVGTIIAVVTEDALDPVAGTGPHAALTVESFDGHLYSVELSEHGGLVIELCTADELEVLPRQ